MHNFYIKIFLFLCLLVVPNISFAEIERTNDPKIIGGKATKAGTRIWQVALLKSNISDNWKAQFCGGTIIDNQWVLTAAHCMEGISPSEVDILVNTHKLNSGGYRIGAKKIIIHKNYNPIIYDSDIALIKLNVSANQPTIDTIRPEQEFLLAPTNAAATVIGWGDIDPDPNTDDFPTQLLEVTVPIVNQQDCFDRYHTIGYEVTSNMICAGYKVGGKDSCQGDSGGPLIVSDLEGGFIQVGVVSWGIGCAEPENYGVYTKLSNYKKWITNNIN